MMDHIGENRAGVLMVLSQLGTAVIVREGDDGVHAVIAGPAGDLFPETRHNLLADAVHAAHGGDYPYLVADAHLPVGPAEALEGTPLGSTGNLHQVRMVAVIQQSLQVGFDAVMIHHRTGRSIPGDMADGKTIFDDIFPFPETVQHDFMAAGDVDKQRYAFHHLSFGKVLERNGHIVGRIDLDVPH